MATWYCIPPANYLDMMADWNTHMIIAPHALRRNAAEKDYYQFYRQNRHLYTIIDNGLWEGHVLSDERLLKMANKLGADEIIAPDSPYGAVTVRKTKQFIQHLKQKDQRLDFKIHGAVHGGNVRDQFKCFYGLLQAGVDIIDLPKSLGPYNRMILLKEFKTILETLDIPVHFLGFYKEELPLLQKHNGMYPRSFDTSVPFKPRYEDGFQLDLPYSWWNKTIIKRRVRYYTKTYI